MDQKKKNKNRKIEYDTAHRNNSLFVDDQIKRMHERFRRSWWNRPVKWFAVLLFISLVLSYISILELGEGGSVTFLSMLVLCLIGYVLEPRAGLLAAFLFGLIKYIVDYVCPGYFSSVISRIINEPGFITDIYRQMSLTGYRDWREGLGLTDPGMVDTVQVIADLFDYLIGYTLLGAFGYLEALSIRGKGSGPGRRMTIQNAFLLAVMLRFIESVINYVVFYPETGSKFLFFREAVTYSFMYVGIEGLLSWGVMYIPQVIDTIQYFRTVAGNEYNEKLYQEYH